jgi:hypothetical protein
MLYEVVLNSKFKTSQHLKLKHPTCKTVFPGSLNVKLGQEYQPLTSWNSHRAPKRTHPDGYRQLGKQPSAFLVLQGLGSVAFW